MPTHRSRPSSVRVRTEETPSHPPDRRARRWTAPLLLLTPGLLLPGLLQHHAVDLMPAPVLVQTAVTFTCVGLALMVGLVFLGYAAGTRPRLPAAATGLLGLVLAAHTAAGSDVLPLLLPAYAGTVVRLEAATYLLLLAALALLLAASFPGAFRGLSTGRPAVPLVTTAPRAALPGWMRTLHTAALVPVLAFSLPAALLAPVVSDAVLPYLPAAGRWLTLLFGLLAAAVLLQMLDWRRRAALWPAAGFGLLIVGSVHYALFTGISAGTPSLLTFTHLAFGVLQCGLLAYRGTPPVAPAPPPSAEIAHRMKELRAATIAAHAASLAKSQFLTSVTHELRTPLTAIMGYVQILRDELQDQLSPDHREFFHAIHSSGDRLLILINDLLDLARIEAGRLDLRLSRVNAAQIVDEVCAQLYPLARSRTLQFDVHLGSDVPPVRADMQRLRQVLLNLVSNAIKFTERGQITIRTYATTLHDGPAVAIAVRDTGPGISPEFMPHLFDRFTQEQRPAAASVPGTGIGLTISRELVARMDGEIRVESTLNVGSTFTVVLPRYEETPEAAPVE